MTRKRANGKGHKMRQSEEARAALEQEGREPIARRWPVTRGMIDKHGTTEFCLGFRALILQMPPQDHPEDCRERIRELIIQTPKG